MIHAKIDENGLLSLLKGGKLTDQWCPYSQGEAQRRCGLWCPQCEADTDWVRYSAMSSAVVSIKTCGGRHSYKADNFLDERESDEDTGPRGTLIDLPTAPISIRARKVLIRNRIRTYEELADKTTGEILKAKQCGKLTLTELRELLGSRGLHFRDELPRGDG